MPVIELGVEHIKLRNTGYNTVLMVFIDTGKNWTQVNTNLQKKISALKYRDLVLLNIYI